MIIYMPHVDQFKNGWYTTGIFFMGNKNSIHTQNWNPHIERISKW